MSQFFEDLTLGDAIEIGSYTFTPEGIKRFASAYDPQPFHLDEEAAKASHFGGLCASGWQTAAVWMKLIIAYHARGGREALKTGQPVARLGPSPGFKDLKWLKPVYAGDTLTYTCRLIDKRESDSRPDWGLVTHHNVATNQHGVPVFEFTATVFWERRAS
jgi:acyl dehydratase